MADKHPGGLESETNNKVSEETTGCGVFDFLKKKDHDKKPEEDLPMTEAEPLKQEEKHILMEKLHRSASNSSSSSDEEVEEGGVKKKKKGLKEKVSGEKEDRYDAERKETSGPVEQSSYVQEIHPDDKKGFMEKIKENIPGHHKKAEEDALVDNHSVQGEQKDSKGILEKIKDKIPGYHKNEDEKKGN
ncbi:Dehydrin [Quillaja saponaria]|uniref:Dehydrin n=1 Tax=Quillaja saponaria TaxID=32244 RepID=A0AAD7QBV5_QUISA|nr:Dehydrin [Quillaja saponaria]